MARATGRVDSRAVTYHPAVNRVRARKLDRCIPQVGLEGPVDLPADAQARSEHVHRGSVLQLPGHRFGCHLPATRIVGSTRRTAIPYSFAYEYNAPYRLAYERLFGRAPSTALSLAAHHMLYDCGLIADMVKKIEQYHGKPWYDAYVEAVDFEEESSISEMDIYGWWVLDRNPEMAYRRQLIWRDTRVIPHAFGRAFFAADFDFVAAHAWARQPRSERGAGGVARLGAELWAGARARASALAGRA